MTHLFLLLTSSQMRRKVSRLLSKLSWKVSGRCAKVSSLQKHLVKLRLTPFQRRKLGIHDCGLRNASRPW